MGILDDLYTEKVYLLEIDHYDPDKVISSKTDISFDTSDDSINATTTDLSIYSIYDMITVSGSTSNDGTYTIQTVSATKITVSENLTTEAAGDTIDLSAVTTLRVTTANGFVTAPGDTPANAYYEPSVSANINTFFVRNMYGIRQTAGASDSSYGEVVLANIDGQYDDLKEHGFDGRNVVIKIGETTTAFSSFITIFTGTIQTAIFSYSELKLVLRDKSHILDLPIQDTRFAGTNSGSTGNEGLAADIEGQPKPLCYGECKNITLVPCNTSAFRYQFHAEGTISAVDNVYDKGVLLTLTTDYTVDASNGIVDLVATPAGTVTADVKGDATDTGYVDSVSNIVKRILVDHTTLTTSDLDTTSFTDLQTANSDTVGVYIATDASVREVIDMLLNSIGAFGYFARDGDFTVGQFTAPSGSTVVDFTTDDILSLEMVSSEDDSDIPTHEVKLGYEKNWTVQSADQIAGSVTDARRAYLQQGYRHTTASDATIKNQYLLSSPFYKDTLLVDSSEADTEASRLLTLYKSKRFIYELSVKATALQLDLNDVVGITYETIDSTGAVTGHRFGLNATKGRVIGISEDPRRNLYTLTVFV